MRGGAPVHGFGNRGAKRIPGSATAGQQSTAPNQQSQASQSASNPLVIVTRGSEGISNVKILKKKPGPMKGTGTLKAASGTRIVHRGKVANIMATNDDYDQQSQASQMSNTPTSSFHTIQSAHVTTMSTKHQRTATANSCYGTKSAMTVDDNIVVIDSSPDEKNCQRIIHETMDYDDDNDKSGIIGTEVSLSSVALTQNAMDGDDVSVIYGDSTAGNDFNIVSSDLLGSEDISEEYQLEFPVFADYVDDGERHTIDSPTEDDSNSKSLTVEDTDNDGEDDNDDVGDDVENDDNDENDFVNLGKQFCFFFRFSFVLIVSRIFLKAYCYYN